MSDRESIVTPPASVNIIRPPVEKGKDTSEYKQTVRVVIGGILISVAGVIMPVITGGTVALPAGAVWGPILGSALASGLYSIGRSLRKRGK